MGTPVPVSITPEIKISERVGRYHTVHVIHEKKYTLNHFVTKSSLWNEQD